MSTPRLCAATCPVPMTSAMRSRCRVFPWSMRSHGVLVCGMEGARTLLGIVDLTLLFLELLCSRMGWAGKAELGGHKVMS